MLIAPGKDGEALAALRRKPRRAHEASCFFHDPGFGCPAVKVLPGEFYVDGQDVAVMTTLGSCVAACLHDRSAGIGGMNHFMLPESGEDGGESGRFGAFAMELLINELQKRGARRQFLEAKIFGGGQVMKSLSTSFIGEMNVNFVRHFLAQERIPVVASDVLDVHARKVCLFPHSGKVLCKRLPATHGAEFEQQEARYRQLLVAQPRGGDVELFS